MGVGENSAIENHNGMTGQSYLLYDTGSRMMVILLNTTTLK